MNENINFAKLAELDSEKETINVQKQKDASKAFP